MWVLGSSGGAGRMREGLKCLTSVNMNVLGKNTMKFAEGSTAAVLAVGFFSSESHWDCLRSWSLGNAVTPAMWMILVAPIFFFVPSYLFISALLVPGVKMKWALCAVSKKAGESDHSPLSPFPHEGNGF